MPFGLSLLLTATSLLFAFTYMVALATYPPDRINPLALRALAPFLSMVVMARLSAKVRRWLRTATYVSGISALSAFGAVSSVLLALVGQAHNVNWVVARGFYYLVGPLVGWKFKVTGEENLEKNRPCVMVGNHQSMIDVLYLGRIFPLRASIMAKKELIFMPFLGMYLWFSNAVLVDRKNRGDAVKSFSKAGQTMRDKKTSIFVFAEGTRSGFSRPDLLPLKKGAFHLAVQAQVPIVPIVCENYWNLYQSGKLFESGEPEIRVLPGIPTTGLTSSHDDITALVEKTRVAMVDALVEMSQNPQAVSYQVGEDTDTRAVENSDKDESRKGR